ncbi:hypothetical protein [Scytonema sp. UIC 10036]|uniref:hypothetical protein n=1 Tax=Scytonema sp. UIC 10036 TaxID=2304196 RepID=UPI001FA9CC80|nr:hypothetical protein [Scytonema sp. UIC 10036]
MQLKHLSYEVVLRRCSVIARLGAIISNLLKSNGQRLIALILLIAIAYTCAILAGRNSRSLGFQKYVGRLKELKR